MTDPNLRCPPPPRHPDTPGYVLGYCVRVGRFVSDGQCLDCYTARDEAGQQRRADWALRTYCVEANVVASTDQDYLVRVAGAVLEAAIAAGTPDRLLSAAACEPDLYPILRGQLRLALASGQGQSSWLVRLAEAHHALALRLERPVEWTLLQMAGDADAPGTAWAALRSLEGDDVGLYRDHQGHRWQYVATLREAPLAGADADTCRPPGRWHHCFIHRCHPDNGQPRRYMVPASVHWTPDPQHVCLLTTYTDPLDQEPSR